MPKSSNDRRHFIIIGVLVIVATLIVNALLQGWLDMPVAAAAEAGTIDGLFAWHILIISFLFSLIVVFMLYSFVVFRRRSGDEGEGEHFEGNTALEIIWTVVPLIIVVVFGYFGVTTLREITQGGEAFAVKVQGFQWAWSFEYPDGVVSAELVLPKDQRVKMEMTSSDVLHSFWIPEFRVKQDLVPGQTTVVYFTPTEEGEYKLRCSELCGLSHWSMLAPVRVVEQDEFALWYDERLAEIAPAVAEAPVGATE